MRASWRWHDSVETCRSVIIYKLIVIVLLLVILQNKNTNNKKHKNSLLFDWCKIINIDRSDHHKEATRMCSDTAVCMQTNHGCCDILHVREYSGTDSSLEEAPGTTVRLLQVGDRIKLAQKRTTGINMYIFYMQIS